MTVVAFQDILSAAGIVLLAVAIGLGAFAFYVFRRNDIPSVIADLTGRSRQRGIEGQDQTFGRTPHAHRKTSRDHRARPARVGKRQPGNGFDPDAPTDAIERSEYVADAPTDVVAGADRLTGMLVLEGDSVTDAIMDSNSATGQGISIGGDSPTELPAEGLDQPTTVLSLGDTQEDGRDADGETAVLTANFVVKRSELMIGSDVVIAVERGGE